VGVKSNYVGLYCKKKNILPWRRFIIGGGVKKYLGGVSMGFDMEFHSAKSPEKLIGGEGLLWVGCL